MISVSSASCAMRIQILKTRWRASETQTQHKKLSIRSSLAQHLIKLRNLSNPLNYMLTFRDQRCSSMTEKISRENMISNFPRSPRLKKRFLPKFSFLKRDGLAKPAHLKIILTRNLVKHAKILKKLLNLLKNSKWKQNKL